MEYSQVVFFALLPTSLRGIVQGVFNVFGQILLTVCHHVSAGEVLELNPMQTQAKHNISN